MVYIMLIFVLDIGAGKGFLTVHLLKIANNVVAIENDTFIYLPLHLHVFRRSHAILLGEAFGEITAVRKTNGGWAVNTPVAVDAELAKRLPELEGVNFRGGILMWVPEIFQIDDPAAHMTWNSWHMGGIERKAIAQGFSFYSPIRYSELPRYYRESPDPVDVAVFQVTPMDEHGYFNFGPSASHLGAVCEKAKKIIVEVNKNMPRCLGGMENCVHISQVTGIVEGDNPPIGQMAAPGAATEVDLKVANLIVPQISNGACLQLGIGGMPNAIGSLIAQSDLKDLGVHTEMYVDAFVDIAKAGKITGARKQLDKGRQVYAFGAGTQKMYDSFRSSAVSSTS